jgi:hypothetical protein
MKFVIFLIGLVMAFMLGYMMEPRMRLALTGISPSEAPKAKAEQKVVTIDADGSRSTGPATVVAPDPAPPPDPEPLPDIDLSALHPSQLPEVVLLKVPVDVTDPAVGLTMTVQAGNRVNLVRLESETAVISPGEGPFEGFVPISGTDLLEQLAANPPPPVVIEPEPEPEPEPAPPPPVIDDEPEEEPEPTILNEEQLVAAMRASIEAGDIKEFTASQVIGWQAGEDEEIDGVAYQTGMVAYRAETIFGERNIQAKALVLNGKVEKWIWPQSGMEIR